VNKQQYVDNPDYETFDVRVEEKRFTGRNASTMILKPCIRYNSLLQIQYIRYLY
jgi:hypothetical protein